MNTTTQARVIWLVCLLASLFGVAQKGMGDPTNAVEAVVVAERLSLERPDPRKPFTSWMAPTGEEASQPSLYLTEPKAQINNPNTRFYISVLIRFRIKATGEWVAIKQPNPTNLSFSFNGRKYREGYAPASVGGAFNILATNSVYTDVATPDPNPTTGKAWIYGVRNGAIVTTAGTKVSLTEADGAVRRNPGEGDFLVNPNVGLEIDEFWVVGAEQKLSTGFVNAANNTFAFWQSFNIPFDMVIEVTNSVAVDAALNTQNGCRYFPDYGAFRFPTIYCGTQDGPVRPVLELATDLRRLTLRHGKFGDWIVQGSGDMASGWFNLPGYKFQAPPDFFLEDRRDMTIELPAPGQITTPPPTRMYFRAYSPKPYTPPYVLSSPP
ncbi:MAG: hypothetical protein RJB39_103 [Candidatus Parcubacteria bacterium]|jgi:hypothetical protein